MSVSPFHPTEEQRAVLEHRGPLLVLAGAGVGKTTVLTERVIDTIDREGVPPEQILAMTFTRKAADEMRSRITDALRERGAAAASDQVVVRTYHGFAGEIVREFGIRLGIAPMARPMSDTEKWGLLDDIFDQLTFNAVEVRSAGHAFENILEFVQDAQNHLLTPRHINDYVARLRKGILAPQAESLVQQWDEMSHAFAAYQNRKLETGTLDYGDQIAYAIEITRSFPMIATALRARHPYVFVDEYQDTNPAQRELVLELVGSPVSNLFVIGDDDQAIFRFQGANVRNILRLPHEMALAPNPPTVMTLVGNRRSRPPILDVANRVANGITERQKKRMTHLRGGRAQIGAYVADTEHDEAAWIASQISNVRNLVSEDESQYAWGDFAVLSRTHATNNVVRDALTAAGIPSTGARRQTLLSHTEIDGIRAMLQVLVTPDNDVAVARVLLSPRWHINESDLRALAQHRNHIQSHSEDMTAGMYVPRPALLDAVMDMTVVDNISTETRERLHVLIAEIQVLTETAQQGFLQDTVKLVIERGGYHQELAARGEPEHVEAQDAIDGFTRIAASFGGTGLSGVRAFLRFLDRADEAEDANLGSTDPPAADPSHVLLTTIHSAKGGEWPVVFIPAFVMQGTRKQKEDAVSRAPYPLRAQQADLPSFRDESFTDDSDLATAIEHREEALAALDRDDERRLIYVALTRAREHLYISRAHWYGETKKPRTPLPYWNEILETGHCTILGEQAPSPANPSLTHPRPRIPRKRPAASIAAEKIEELLADDQPDAAVAMALNGVFKDKTWESLRDAALTDLSQTRTRSPLPQAPSSLQVHSTSYTALDHFQTCPRLYRHRYVDHLPTRPHPARQRGSTLHRILAATGGHSSDLFVEDDDHLHGELRNALADQPELLERFTNSRWGQRQATHVELGFSLAINNHVLRGSIDRIDRLDDDTIEIVDFKTGIHRPEHELQDDLQLPIYALAAAELLRSKPDQIHASLYYLGSDREWTMEWSEDRAATARRRIARLLDEMTTSTFAQTDDISKCRSCDFAHVCER